MKDWMKAALTRAVRTAAQAAIGIIGASALVTEVDWALVASGTALAAILSLLMSLAGLPEADGGKSPLAGGDEDGM